MQSEHVDLPTGARVFVATKGSCDELVLFPCDPDPGQVDLLADAVLS